MTYAELIDIAHNVAYSVSDLICWCLQDGYAISADKAQQIIDEAINN